MTDDDSINSNHTNNNISNFKSLLLNNDAVKYSPTIFSIKYLF